MDKNELKEIMNLLYESSDDAEDMLCKYNDSEYMLKLIDEDGWSDEGKYQSNEKILALLKDGVDTDIRVSQGVYRTGDHWSGHEYEYYDLEQVEEVEVTVKKWVKVK